ncbi:MAG: FAD-dependent oxidoreductase [Bacteroidia bacterium]|nr:FAD-dependent oxidoreductase [Bacteroidia bacterium]MDW8015112.1 FAD-dependent oxidoreductase [Bacteroidia bacterium]
MGSSLGKLIIVGSGSSGLGTALAAARRGWQVLILEARDIGGGTSTTSTKLIHGGIRYLESALKRLSRTDWQLVQEALQERYWMINSHPQLCRPLPIVIPTSNLWERGYYGFGLKLYDWLSFPYRLEAPRWLDQNALYKQFPTMKEGFKGGWLYWDGQFEDRLYAVHLALFLRQRFNVEIRPYHRVTQAHPRKNSIKVEIETADGERYTEEGDFLINATGPWSDFLRRALVPTITPRLRISRGSHLVLEGPTPLFSGFLIPRTTDGRIIFVLPWKEGYWLLGTTDVEAQVPEWNPAVPSEEESYLLAHLNRYFEGEFKIKARFAGFRPLVAANEKSPTARLARTHVIEVWSNQRCIHILGGKWTTFRKMGEDVMKSLYEKVIHTSLPEGASVEQIVPDLSALEALKRAYPSPILPQEPFTEGEVRFWRRLGWAYTPADIVEGRWQLHLIDESRANQLKASLQERWNELT